MDKHINLSVIVISKTANLPQRFFRQLEFADEVLVVYHDADKINKEFKNSRVRFLRFAFPGSFAKLRNYSLSKARGEWVMFVDTDEIISKSLAKEILGAISNNKIQGYYVPRLDSVFHKVLLHGETGSITILRLARKNAGKFYRSVHEVWKIKGKTKNLINPLIHQKDHFVSEFIGRIDTYSQLDSKQLSNENKPFNYFRLIVYPKAKFILNYFFKKGFLDGNVGLFQAYLMSIQSLSVRIFQWEQKK